MCSVSLPDWTQASIRAFFVSLTQSLVLLGVRTMNSYSPVSGANTEPCHFAAYSLGLIVARSGLSFLKSNRTSGSTRLIARLPSPIRRVL